jgi:hypothetical protein
LKKIAIKLSQQTNIYALVYESIIPQLEEDKTTLFNAGKDSFMISTGGRVPYAGETVFPCTSILYTKNDAEDLA